MSYEREANVEEYFVREVALHGGKAYKWVSPGNKGVPDRIVFFPNGRCAAVELKAPKGVLSPQQRIQHRVLGRLLAGNLYVIYSKEGVDEFIRRFVSEI